MPDQTILRNLQRILVRMTLATGLFVTLPVVALGIGIGWTQTTYIDPDRGNRAVESTIYYPSEFDGEEVPVAEGNFPLVVFGHGYLIPPSDYQYLWTGLVPEGFIIVLPLTEGNLLPDHEEFGRDLAFLVTALNEEGDRPGSLFFGHVGENSAVMGHSMGGGASVLAASFSTEITGLANLAAAETSPSAIDAAAEVTIPALVLAGSHDCVTPPEQHQIPIYQALSSDCRTYVNITGASHCQFAEENFLCSLGEGGCPEPTISRAEQHDLTLALLGPWLRFTLTGDSAGWSAFQELLESGDGIGWEQDCEPLSAVGTIDRSVSREPVLRTYPSPARGRTALRFEIARPVTVEISIHDATGRRVRLLHRGLLDRGDHEVSWDWRDDRGRALPHGIYLGHLRTNVRRASARLILIR